MPPSQPTSPITRSRKRMSLRLSSYDGSQDLASQSPNRSGTTSFTSFSRRSSRTSRTSCQPQSPCTPRPKSSRSSRHSFQRRRSSRASLDSTGSLGLQEAPSDLGNLADELDQAWDGDGDLEHQGSSFLEGLREGDSAVAQAEVQSPYAVNDMPDLGLTNIMLQSPMSQKDNQTFHIPPSPQTRQSPPKARQAAHNRIDSAYDGSDYGSDHDEDDLSSFPPLLRKRMREIERLSRDTHSRESLAEGGGTVARTVSALRHLGPPQSDVEYGVTRVSTAYLSMATHRSHKQREIFALTHSLLYGNAGTELPEEILDLLISDLNDLTTTVSFLQGQNPLLSLQILASQTSDLAQTLRGLTDSLQETKLATTAAQRKLRSVRDMVEDMRVEEELVDQSILLIQMGDWDRRCRDRQAGKICREVVKGFGERWDVEIPKVGEVAV